MSVSPKGQYSNIIVFDEAKRYVVLQAQRNKPLLDAELRELNQSLLSQVTRLTASLLGETASPLETFSSPDSAGANNAFRVTESALPSNNFTITGGNGLEDPGILYIDGFRVFLKGSFDYSSQGDYMLPGETLTDALHRDNYTKTTVPELTKPSADRTDIVYVDLSFAEVSADTTSGSEYTDPAITDPVISTHGTANRLRAVIDIKVFEGWTGTTGGEIFQDPAFGPYTQNQVKHLRCPIAILARKGNDAGIRADMITDLLTLHGKRVLTMKELTHRTRHGGYTTADVAAGLANASDVSETWGATGRNQGFGTESLNTDSVTPRVLDDAAKYKMGSMVIGGSTGLIQQDPELLLSGEAVAGVLYANKLTAGYAPPVDAARGETGGVVQASSVGHAGSALFARASAEGDAVVIRDGATDGTVNFQIKGDGETLINRHASGKIIDVQSSDVTKFSVEDDVVSSSVPVSIEGTLTVKRGAGLDSDDLIIAQDGAGDVTASIKGDGSGIFSTLLKVARSATGTVMEAFHGVTSIFRVTDTSVASSVPVTVQGKAVVQQSALLPAGPWARFGYAGQDAAALEDGQGFTQNASGAARVSVPSGQAIAMFSGSYDPQLTVSGTAVTTSVPVVATPAIMQAFPSDHSYAHFGHKDHTGSNDYGLRVSVAGAPELNAAAGQVGYLNHDNSWRLRWGATDVLANKPVTVQGSAYVGLGLGLAPAASSFAQFSNATQANSATAYGMVQAPDGTIYMSAASGASIYLRNDNQNKLTVSGGAVSTTVPVLAPMFNLGGVSDLVNGAPWYGSGKVADSVVQLAGWTGVRVQTAGSSQFQVSTDNAGTAVQLAVASGQVSTSVPLTVGGDVSLGVVAGTASRGIGGQVAGSDFWSVKGSGTADNQGYLEISTGDDGTEPIYVRQYQGASIAHELTLLDGQGNTYASGNVTARQISTPSNVSLQDILGGFGGIAGQAAPSLSFKTSLQGDQSYVNASDKVGLNVAGTTVLEVTAGGVEAKKPFRAPSAMLAAGLSPVAHAFSSSGEHHNHDYWFKVGTVDLGVGSSVGGTPDAASSITLLLHSKGTNSAYGWSTAVTIRLKRQGDERHPAQVSGDLHVVGDASITLSSVVQCTRDTTDQGSVYNLYVSPYFVYANVSVTVLEEDDNEVQWSFFNSYWNTSTGSGNSPNGTFQSVSGPRMQGDLVLGGGLVPDAGGGSTTTGSLSVYGGDISITGNGPTPRGNLVLSGKVHDGLGGFKLGDSISFPTHPTITGSSAGGITISPGSGNTLFLDSSTTVNGGLTVSNGSFIGDGAGGFNLGFGSQSPRLSLASSSAETIVATVPVSMPCLVQAAGSVTASSYFTLPYGQAGSVFLLYSTVNVVQVKCQDGTSPSGGGIIGGSTRVGLYFHNGSTWVGGQFAPID